MMEEKPFSLDESSVVTDNVRLGSCSLEAIATIRDSLKEWEKTPLNMKEAWKILYRFKLDVLLCTFMTTQELTNGEFSDCMGKVFEYVMKILREKAEE